MGRAWGCWPLALAAFSGLASAQSAASLTDRIDWKLTASQFQSRPGAAAYDINLRGSAGDTAFWIGHFQRGADFRQARFGLERWHEIPAGRLLTTVQLAQGAYVNASVQLEAGQAAIKPLLGFSRTNLRDYFNIDFNPNDAFLVGAALDAADGTRWSLYAVQDNRIVPGQRVTHLNYRPAFTEGRRLMLDVFFRSGRIPETGEKLSALGVAATWDVKPMFLKIALDRRANFGDADMVRVSAGTRF